MAEITDKYRVLKELGKGGFGTVYLAEHVDLGAKYAIKLLNQNISEDEDLINRFKREAEVLMRLVHRNSVQLRDFGRTSDGLYYMAMDYCEGRSLKDILKETGFLPPSRALSIGIQILEVFDQAHSMGIIHRDIKPDNIMIEVDDQGREIPKVLDFGIAKLKASTRSQRETALTKEGAIIGTPLYMSPEQASGDDLDHRSDLYSLGIVLYEMLCGKPPFNADTITNILLKQITLAPQPFREAAPHLQIPRALEEGVFKALAKKREDRFENARAFRETLETLKNQTLLPEDLKIKKLDDDLLSTRTMGSQVPTPLQIEEARVLRREEKSPSSFLKGMVFVAILGVLGGLYFYSSIFDFRKGEPVLSPKKILIFRDSQAPQIILEGGRAEVYTKEKRVVVKGRVEKKGPVVLLWNNREVALTLKGEFSLPVEMGSDQERQINLLARDKAGNETPLSVKILKDFSAPKINIVSFPGLQRFGRIVIYKREIIINGYLEDPAGVAFLKIKGEDIPLKEEKPGIVFFEKKFLLESGGNHLKFEWADPCGNKAIRIFSIISLRDVSKEYREIRKLMEEGKLVEAQKLFLEISRDPKSLNSTSRYQLRLLEKDLSFLVAKKSDLEITFLYGNQRFSPASPFNIKKIQIGPDQEKSYIYRVEVKCSRGLILYGYIFELEETGDGTKCHLRVSGETVGGEKNSRIFEVKIVPQIKVTYNLFCLFTTKPVSLDWLQKTLQQFRPSHSRQRVFKEILSFFSKQKTNPQRKFFMFSFEK